MWKGRYCAIGKAALKWLLLVMTSSLVTSAQEVTWYSGNVTRYGPVAGEWGAEVCVHLPRHLPQCGWRLQLKFSRHVIYALSSEASLYHIASIGNRYEFENRTHNGDLSSDDAYTAGSPFCLPFSGVFTGSGTLDIGARMRCVCLLE